MGKVQKTFNQGTISFSQQQQKDEQNKKEKHIYTYAIPFNADYFLVTYDDGTTVKFRLASNKWIHKAVQSMLHSAKPIVSTGGKDIFVCLPNRHATLSRAKISDLKGGQKVQLSCTSVKYENAPRRRTTVRKKADTNETTAVSNKRRTPYDDDDRTTIDYNNNNNNNNSMSKTTVTKQSQKMSHKQGNTTSTEYFQNGQIKSTSISTFDNVEEEITFETKDEHVLSLRRELGILKTSNVDKIKNEMNEGSIEEYIYHKSVFAKNEMLRNRCTTLDELKQHIVIVDRNGDRRLNEDFLGVCSVPEFYSIFNQKPTTKQIQRYLHKVVLYKFAQQKQDHTNCAYCCSSCTSVALLSSGDDSNKNNNDKYLPCYDMSLVAFNDIGARIKFTLNNINDVIDMFITVFILDTYALATIFQDENVIIVNNLRRKLNEVSILAKRQSDYKTDVNNYGFHSTLTASAYCFE